MSDDLKARLLKPRVPEGTVDLEGVGTVRVRGLSRGEVFMTQQAKGVEAMERKILALGMLDPALTEAEVKAWQENSPAGEIEPVSEKIRELSGLVTGADKSGVPGDGDESGPGVRDVPGPEAVDHGGGAAGADEQ
jgi:hypothetical protein